MPPAKPPERLLVFDKDFLEDLTFWTEKQPRTAAQLLKLMEAVRRDPFAGIGRPEQLKHLGPGVWSRRLTQEHRLVYVVGDDRITFVQGRYHY